MLLFWALIGICETFVFFIALLYFQGKCENPKLLSELSLPESLSNKVAYHNGAYTYDQLKGLNYFSKLTVCVKAICNELSSQTKFINNTRGLPWFFCFLILTGLPIFLIKCLGSINAFCRVTLVIGIIIVTVFIFIIADVITDHLRSSHRYDELYDYLPEIYRQLINNPLPYNEYDFCHEDYCVTMLYKEYIHRLQEHLKLNRSRLSKTIGGIIVSLIFTFVAFSIFILCR